MTDAKEFLHICHFFSYSVLHLPFAAFSMYSGHMPGIKRKPEFHAVIIILYAVFLMEAFHDSFHNGKTDTAAAVLSCPRFIHFVEFIPEIGDIRFRNRRTRIKYRYSHSVFFRMDTYLDPFLPFQMIQRIAHIIGDNLLNLKLIRPD